MIEPKGHIIRYGFGMLFAWHAVKKTIGLVFVPAEPIVKIYLFVLAALSFYIARGLLKVRWPLKPTHADH